MQILSFREVYKGFFHGRHKYVLRRVNFKRIEENLNQKKKCWRGAAITVLWSNFLFTRWCCQFHAHFLTLDLFLRSPLKAKLVLAFVQLALDLRLPWRLGGETVLWLLWGLLRCSENKNITAEEIISQT